MRRYPLLYLALPAALLAGCQSARVAVLLPPVATYSAAPREPALRSQVSPAIIPVEPVLLASVSPVVTPVAPPAPASRMPPAIQDALKQPVRALPDTSLVRPATSPTPRQIKQADTKTTTVNIFGGLLLLLGIAMLIAGIGAGGLYGLALFIYGFVPLILSIPLLLFKSKYSTRRLANEKRKAARKAARHN